MAGNDAAEVVVGANGQVYVSPTDTPGPTDSTGALDADFIELGFVSEDGATVTDSKDVENIGAWQSFYAIRRIITGREFTVAFALRQWNGDTVTLAFGGGEVTENATGEFEYAPPEPETLDERSLVLDWQDGTRNFRLYVPRGIVSDNVETNITRASAADLPINFAALPLDTETAIFSLFTDDPAFAPGS